MASVNKCILVGRLGSDPEKRITTSGKAVCNVSLATQDKKDGPTEWHRLTFWEKKAELIEQYCKKGSQIYVEGSIQYSEWTDKDGNKKPQTTINVWQMQFLDSKPQNGQQYQSSNGQANAGPQAQSQHQQPSGNSGQLSQQVPPQVAAQFPDAEVVDDVPF